MIVCKVFVVDFIYSLRSELTLVCDSFFFTTISKVSERDRENGAKSIQDDHHKNQVERENET